MVEEIEEEDLTISTDTESSKALNSFLLSTAKNLQITEFDNTNLLSKGISDQFSKAMLKYACRQFDPPPPSHIRRTNVTAR